MAAIEGLGFGEWQDTHSAAEASFLTRQSLQSHCPSFFAKMAPNPERAGRVDAAVAAGAAVDLAAGSGVPQATHLSAETSFLTSHALQSHWPGFLANWAPNPEPTADIDGAAVVGAIGAVVLDEALRALQETQLSAEASFLTSQTSQSHCPGFLLN